MICLMVSQSSLSMTTIFFYTCFWIPFLQMKRVVARVFGHVLFFSDCKKPEEDYMCCSQFSLPAARFEDLLLQTQDNNTSTTKGRTGQVVEETCSICLVEFEKEDVVSQLSKCGHVFHMDCIERWMDRNNFTCPLCRSLIFNVNTSHAKWDDDIPDTTTSSYINGFSWHY